MNIIIVYQKCFKFISKPEILLIIKINFRFHYRKIICYKFNAKDKYISGLSKKRANIIKPSSLNQTPKQT